MLRWIMRNGHWAILVAMITLSGCANIQTVSRSSTIPFGATKGRAIHLDAQQRLVVFAAGKFCAEPSPDALAAYASALGVSGSRLPKETIAASSALSSMAGSIGLRTQSITLMRDSLYRTCEASLNKNLSDSQVAVLMARSQDLTAVILAIEQLTGAVAAPPITLAGSGSASAAATLMANTEALKQARAAEGKAKSERDAAEILKNEAETAYDAAKTETANRRAASDAMPADVEKAKLLTEQLEVEKNKRVEFDTANADFKLKDDAHTLQKQTADQIAALRDASSNMTSAGVGGTSHAGQAVVYRSQLTDVAAEKIAGATKDLVTKLLDKTYFADACMAILMQPSETNAVARQLQGIASRQGAHTADGGIDMSALAANDAAKTLLATEASLKTTCLTYFDSLATRALN